MTVGYLIPAGISTIQPLHLRLREHGRKGDREIGEIKEEYSTCYKIVYSKHNRRAAPVKSQDYCCLSKINMLTWLRESHRP